MRLPTQRGGIARDGRAGRIRGGAMPQQRGSPFRARRERVGWLDPGECIPNCVCISPIGCPCCEPVFTLPGPDPFA